MDAVFLSWMPYIVAAAVMIFLLLLSIGALLAWVAYGMGQLTAALIELLTAPDDLEADKIPQENGGVNVG